MGITGLLPFLEKASSACHLKDLRGKCVAIDSYCWLHRGAFGCAERLARGEQTDAHIRYCLKYVQLLLSYNIKPILVFDGRHLPAKAATEAKRRESRENARKRGAELLRLGRIDEARSFLRRCVDITHEMALQLIQECRKRNVDCVVAPYEADAQLAFLNRADIAQYVITEDSDLVLFGCSRILFKLDLTGNGRLVESTKLHLAMGCREERYQFVKFRQMCILSGCDYLESLPGIGLAKACRFILKTEDPDIKRALAKIPAYLNMRQLVVTEEYKAEFLKAEATFKHMVVYDPVERRQKRLTDPLDEGTPEEYCCNAGVFLDEDTAFNLALGNLDPFSLRPLDDWHPDKVTEAHGAGEIKRSRHPSIWQQNSSSAGEEGCEKQSLHATNTQQQQTFVKRPLMNAAFEEQGTKDTIADVLQAYGIETATEPPMKRLCPAEKPSIRSIAFGYEEVNVLEAMTLLERGESPKRNRNPFLVATNAAVSCREASNALLSPTKITPSNRSLLQNVSPVKRIDYSASGQTSGQRDFKVTSQSDNTATTAVTASRLSRFKRTNTIASCSISAGQKVISRFFCSQTSTGSTGTVNNDGDPIQDPKEATVESPTAIVRKFKSKQETQKLAAAALYLRSPEAQLKLRGDRTPEKRRTGCDYGTGLIEPASPSVEEALVTKVDSGIGGIDDETNASEGDGLSLSQKENDDNALNTVAAESSETKGRKTVRLSLFERKHATKIESEENMGSDDLAIVLDDDASDGGAEGKAENRTGNESTKTDLNTERGKPTFTNTAGGHTRSEKKTNSKPSCRRPGLSAVRGKPSKDAAGLTQSRLSMFGFQKKSSMQLDKR
ncbi:exonuclease 1 [Anopheles aquasalis]|uniref:exonuclease 1 n=1 Tax=Anopheles aquasalis TaxID=42839 RepID=UPI00215A3B5C|nr:exonuclease 1 [Anopheles aquasalis]